MCVCVYDKVPWSEAADEDVVKLCLRRERPMHKDAPSYLQHLMDWCWNPEPAVRIRASNVGIFFQNIAKPAIVLIQDKEVSIPPVEVSQEIPLVVEENAAAETASMMVMPVGKEAEEEEAEEVVTKNHKEEVIENSMSNTSDGDSLVEIRGTLEEEETLNTDSMHTADGSIILAGRMAVQLRVIPEARKRPARIYL
jgi:hypothetical protein